MADWTLHIVSDRLLVLSGNDHVSMEMCHRVREELKPMVEATGTRFLVLSAVEVRDMRNAPPPVVAAAELVDAWMRDHTHDGSDDLPSQRGARA